MIKSEQVYEKAEGLEDCGLETDISGFLVQCADALEQYEEADLLGAEKMAADDQTDIPCVLLRHGGAMEEVVVPASSWNSIGDPGMMYAWLKSSSLIPHDHFAHRATANSWIFMYDNHFQSFFMALIRA